MWVWTVPMGSDLFAHTEKLMAAHPMLLNESQIEELLK
jgi:hypothetical protein